MNFRGVFLLSLPKSPLVRNGELPVCVRCAHFMETLSRDPYDRDSLERTGRCGKFGVKNLVSGTVYNERAEICRLREDLCGQKGAHFTELDAAPL